MASERVYLNLINYMLYFLGLLWEEYGIIGMGEGEGEGDNVSSDQAITVQALSQVLL